MSWRVTTADSTSPSSVNIGVTLTKSSVYQSRGASSLEVSLHPDVGRTSVPPERLLKVSLLTSLYSARSRWAFCEGLEYNLLFHWFLDMNLPEHSFATRCSPRTGARWSTGEPKPGSTRQYPEAARSGTLSYEYEH